MIRSKALCKCSGLALLLGLGGCMAPRIDIASELQKYGQASSCCQKLDQAEIHQLRADRQTDITIDSHSQAFLLPSGLSYFYLAKVPEGSEMQLRIRSHIYSGGDRMYLFYPIVSYLDDRFNIVQSITSDSARYVSLCSPGHMDWNEEPGEELVSTIDTKNVRYLVIYTTPDLVKNGRRYEVNCQGSTIAAGGAFVTAGGGQTEVHPLGSPVTFPGGITLMLSTSTPTN